MKVKKTVTETGPLFRFELHAGIASQYPTCFDGTPRYQEMNNAMEKV